MKKHLAAALLVSGALLAVPAQAHRSDSEMSALSTLPLASIVVGASGVVGVAVAMPVALSAGGATLVVKAVEAGSRGAVCVLERVSDGARASIEIGARGAGQASLAVGTVVTATVTGAGVVLSAAGEAIAFIPNAVGASLLYNERLTY